MGNAYDKRGRADILRVTSMAVEGFTYQEIAETMSISSEQVEGKLKAGLRWAGVSLSEARQDKESTLKKLREFYDQ